MHTFRLYGAKFAYGSTLTRAQSVHPSWNSQDTKNVLQFFVIFSPKLQAPVDVGKRCDRVSEKAGTDFKGGDIPKRESVGNECLREKSAGAACENFKKFQECKTFLSNFHSANDHSNYSGSQRESQKIHQKPATPTFFAHPWGRGPREYIEKGIFKRGPI